MDFGKNFPHMRGSKSRNLSYPSQINPNKGNVLHCIVHVFVRYSKNKFIQNRVRIHYYCTKISFLVLNNSTGKYFHNDASDQQFLVKNILILFFKSIKFTITVL